MERKTEMIITETQMLVKLKWLIVWLFMLQAIVKERDAGNNGYIYYTSC